MKSNFRQRFAEKAYSKEIYNAAMKGALQQLDDAAIRATNKMMYAMLLIGLSPKTVCRVQKELADVEKDFAENADLSIADYAVYKRLTDAGIKAEMPKNEV